MAALEGSAPKTVESVTLASIAWVLEPELASRPACAGRPWHIIKESFQDKQVKQQHERRVQLVQYYQAQLRVFAEMCFSRSYNCIRELEKIFSFDMLVVGMLDENLPKTLRSTFILLCRRLYIDRFPHSELQLPTLVRVWPEGPSVVDLHSCATLPQFRLAKGHPLLESAEAFLNLANSNKMHLVENFISDHFVKLGSAQILKDEAMNTFTEYVLSMLQHLATLGFYGTLSEIKDVVGPLIAALDPRADVNTRKELADRVESVSALDTSHDDPVALDILDSLDAIGFSANAHEERWKAMTPQSYLVLRSKEYMMKVLLYFCQVRLDYQMSCCLASYKKLVSSAGEDAIFTRGMKMKNLENFSLNFGRGFLGRTSALEECDMVQVEQLAAPMLKKFSA